MKQPTFETVNLEKIVGGGQALGRLANGKKVFVWGGLPEETVEIQLTKKKSSFVEGVVTSVLEANPQRITPKDTNSYLSTSPWQIMSFDAEQHYKAALIEEAFELHDVVLPEPIAIFSNQQQFEYRNKIEFSFWWSNDTQQLDLAFFRRGTHGKIPVEGTSLASPAISKTALALRNILRQRGIEAFALKTAIIRSSLAGEVIVQLYVKDETFPLFTEAELSKLPAVGFELIFSNPKSPASVITTRLQQWGKIALTDTILGIPFTYATEGFFQINIPVYEQALRDMQQFVDTAKPTTDLYSGVGSIGLTIGGENVTLVEINEHAVREMERNIASLKREGSVKAVLAASEDAIEYISKDATIIVDPPRAGLHEKVIKKLLETQPSRIIYLSCNPVTQARDVALLAEKYGIRYHRGYNFFPRTPHIEHLTILDSK